MPANALLPQQPPFQLVDFLDIAEPELIQTRFAVPDRHPLLQGDHLSEAGLIENMAQTAAAGSGYQYSRKAEAVPVGYIGAIKNLKVHRLPKKGEVIKTSVRPQYQVGQASIVSAECRMADEVLASCELTIFVS